LALLHRHRPTALQRCWQIPKGCVLALLLLLASYSTAMTRRCRCRSLLLLLLLSQLLHLLQEAAHLHLLQMTLR
jgi:hypothetical protein